MMRMEPIAGVRTSNHAERLVATGLHDGGYTVLKNGWPDFLAYDEYGRVRFIEVKPNCRHRLSHRQRRMADVLASIGITVEVIVAECVCGRCQPALVKPSNGLHDGSHPDCSVCAPLRGAA